MGELTGRLRNVDSKLLAPRNVELAKTTLMLHGLPAHYACIRLLAPW